MTHAQITTGFRSTNIWKLVASMCTVALAVVACSSSDDGSGGPSTQVKDKLGRTCTIKNAAEVTCDQPAQPTGGCKAGATACFNLGSTGDASGPGAICAACCSGNTSTSSAGDCANITCSTAADCVSPYGRCVNGQCRY